MANPVISWWNVDNTAQVLTWPIGVVDAGTVSGETTLHIWNNRGAGTAVSHMTECTLTTTDSAGTYLGTPITGQWIKMKCLSIPPGTAWSAIGGATGVAIGSGTPVDLEGGPSNIYAISGAINGGTVASTVNFAKVVLKLDVPSNAPAGLTNFMLRVNYKFQ